MKDSKNFGFDFGDEYEDIVSSSTKKKNDDFEDIVSDSGKVRYNNSGSMNFTSFSDRDDERYYYRKKHGVAKVLSNAYYKTRKWWKCMKKGRRAAFITLTSFFLVILIGVVWFFSNFSYNYRRITGDPDDLGFKNIIDKKVLNIALFGLDTRGVNSFKGNSDSIMILSINTETKKIKIFSVMRDSLVPIERNGKITYNKINSAYGWGGPELAIKTLNQAFGLDISEYATVNFYGMTDIIDAVGGIEATITDDELKWKGEDRPNLNGCMQEICSNMNLDVNKYYITTSGTQHLNGVQAVAYARIRYCTNVWGTNNDFGRTDRQRYVMEQLFNKAKTLPKSQYVKLAKALIPCTETSLSYNEIMGVAFNVMFDSPTFEQVRIPQNSSEMNFTMPSPSGSFGSVVYYDLDYVKKLIHSVIYDDITLEEYVSANGIQRNDWYGKLKGGNVPQKPSAPVSEPPKKDSSGTTSSGSDKPDTDTSSDTNSDTSSNSSTVSNPDDGDTKPDNNSSTGSDGSVGNDKKPPED